MDTNITVEECYSYLKTIHPSIRISVGVRDVGQKKRYFVSMIGLRNVHFKTFYGDTFKEAGKRYLNEASIPDLERAFDPFTRVPKRSFPWSSKPNNTQLPQPKKLLNNKALGAKNRVIRRGKPDNTRHSSLNNLLYNLASGLKPKDLVRSEVQLLKDAYGKDWRKMITNFMKVPSVKVIQDSLNLKIKEK